MKLKNWAKAWVQERPRLAQTLSGLNRMLRRRFQGFLRWDEEVTAKLQQLPGWMLTHAYEEARRAPAIGRHAPRMPKFLLSLLSVLVVAVAAGYMIFFSYALLVGAVNGWPLRPHFIPDNRDKLADAVKTAVTILGVLGGAFVVVYSYRKQRVEEAAGHRADDEQLARRYQDAASQLGHERAAVRLAGVYAMAQLADQWPDQRQTCVDVLCTYARFESPQGDEDDTLVRGAIYSLLRQHLHPDAVVSWSDLRFDFRNATFRDLNLSGVMFKTRPSFAGAHFNGKNYFTGATFHEGGDFNEVTINGRLEMNVLHVESNVSMHGSTVARGGYLNIFIKDFGERGGNFDVGHSVVDGGQLLVHGTHTGSTHRIGAAAITVRGDAVVTLMKEGIWGDFVTGAINAIDAPYWILESGHVILDKALFDLGAIWWEPQSQRTGAHVERRDMKPAGMSIRPEWAPLSKPPVVVKHETADKNTSLELKDQHSEAIPDHGEPSHGPGQT